MYAHIRTNEIRKNVVFYLSKYYAKDQRLKYASRKERKRERKCSKRENIIYVLKNKLYGVYHSSDICKSKEKNLSVNNAVKLL